MQSAFAKFAVTVVTLLLSTQSWAQTPVRINWTAVTGAQSGIREWRWCGDQAWILASAGMTE